MSSTNRGAERRLLDAYTTPPWCVALITPHLLLDGPVLDPCCGDGAILDALRAAGHEDAQVGLDVDPCALSRGRSVARRTTWCADFLAWAPRTQIAWTLVSTNPPYAHAEHVVRRALALQAPHEGTTAMLLRLNFLGSRKRLPLWAEWGMPNVYVLTPRPSFTNGGTDSCEYAWFVWGPGRTGRVHVLAKPTSNGA